MSDNEHWGEPKDVDKEESNVGTLSPADIEDLLTPQVSVHVSSAPTIHQPSQEETPSFQILSTDFCRTDPVVLQTIRLLQYQRLVVQCMNRAQTSGGDNNVHCLPPPEEPRIEQKYAKLHSLNFLPPETGTLRFKPNEAQAEVEGATARLILRKSIATICAHSGYHDTTESVLKLLTDAADDFLSKLTGLIRVNVDNLSLTGANPFQDAVEHALQDMNVGSLSDLHTMYSTQVLAYHESVRSECHNLYQQYLKILPAAAASAHIPPLQGRVGGESSSDMPWEESGGSGAQLAPGLEEASLASIKSSSSLDHDGSLHPFSVLSQGIAGDGEELIQGSPMTASSTTQFHHYPLTPR